MTTWFTADFHLGHANIIKYCNRPFKDVHEMDAAILDNLSAAVEIGDILYYLGDIAFSQERVKDFIDRMHDVKIFFIHGNHDKQAIPLLVKENIPVAPLMDIAVGDQKITLCHYAMRVWNESHFNAWQLYGHSHGAVPPLGKQWDVGVDNNNFKPLSLARLACIMERQPDNPNYIPPEKRC